MSARERDRDRKSEGGRESKRVKREYEREKKPAKEKENVGGEK